jgi:hypothetical protein
MTVSSQFRVVSSPAARDAIPLEERSKNMCVFVETELTVFQLGAADQTELPLNNKWFATGIFEKGQQVFDLIIKTSETGFTRRSFEQFCKERVDEWCARLNTKAFRRRMSDSVTFRCSVYADTTVNSVERYLPLTGVPDDSLFMGEATLAVLTPFYKTAVASETGTSNFIEGNLGLSCTAMQFK